MQGFLHYLPLFRNFEESFAALAQSGREIPKELQASILVALMVARVSSYLTREIAAASRSSVPRRCLQSIPAIMPCGSPMTSTSSRPY